MNMFETIRINVIARTVAEYYGLKVNRNKMACCPFHSDRTPSMKIDRRYYCFGCGEKGDTVDYVSKIFGLSLKDAAIKICEDFGLPYDKRNIRHQPRAKPIKPVKTKEQIFREKESRAYRVFSDYYHLLMEWKSKYAPKSLDEEWHPYFIEALQNLDQVAYQLDTILTGSDSDRAFLITDNERKVTEIEERIRNYRKEYSGRSVQNVRTDGEKQAI